MLVYLAGGISGQDRRKVIRMRTEARDALSKAGYVVFCPFYAFLANDAQIDNSCARKMTSINRYVITKSDVMVVVGELSLGTCREIEVARHNALPVYVVTLKPSGSIEARDLYMCPSLRGAIAAMKGGLHYEISDISQPVERDQNNTPTITTTVGKDRRSRRNNNL